MQFERHNTLSQEGEARRDAMLSELIGVMQSHHQRRRVRRNLAACGAVLLLLVGTWYFVASAGSTTPEPTVALAQQPARADEAESTHAAVRIVRVETDPSIVDRYRAAPANLVVVIDDRELLDALHAFDRGAGLVRMGEKAFVTAFAADEVAPMPARPNSL